MGIKEELYTCNKVLVNFTLLQSFNIFHFRRHVLFLKDSVALGFLVTKHVCVYLFTHFFLVRSSDVMREMYS